MKRANESKRLLDANIAKKIVPYVTFSLKRAAQEHAPRPYELAMNPPLHALRFHCSGSSNISMGAAPGWCGESPELLFRISRRQDQASRESFLFESTALAGTQPAESAASFETESYRAEHEAVVVDLSQSMKAWVEDWNWSSTSISKKKSEIPSGSLRHAATALQMEVRAATTLFESKDSDRAIEDLLRRMHPSAAVGVFPRTNELMNVLKEWEREESRTLHGHILCIRRREMIEAWVLMRGAEFHENEARVTIGVGMTSLSDPLKEWKEVLWKLQSVQKKLELLR
jgi:isochorismate synthase EntC